MLTCLNLLASADLHILDATKSIYGFIAVGLFVIAYITVIGEEYLHLRKSKPMILAAGLIWAVIAIYITSSGVTEVIQKEQLHDMEKYVSSTLVEYAELLLFLLVAMTYINAMSVLSVFNFLQSYLVRKGFSYKQLFWITGLLAFFISPVADNLTTALLMGTVILALGEGNKKFISLCFINIVVAANAGGAFSPFGDITTLMVWQAGKITFWEFFKLFIPSLTNFLVPAIIMSFAIPKGRPVDDGEQVQMRRGAKRICSLFLLTLIISVCYKQFLHLPPFMGMMTGFSFLMLFGYYLKITGPRRPHRQDPIFNIFAKIEKAEWDTLLFFFGVIFCVAGLAFMGYLKLSSELLYAKGHTIANISSGVISAFIDNIPVMLAILTMNPDMSHYQWLLVTLTAGVGGSLLSIGSAAGVGLMGHSKGQYTFMSHLKWSWAVALGFVASIYVHYLMNG